MSFPRLTLLVLPLVVGLALLTGACGMPLALTAASYGADGVSLAETNKTAADHLASMVSKKDCALWRMFRNQDVCRARDGDHDPYDVNYTEPFRLAGEGGVEYLPPPHAAADAPPTSWDAEAYARPETNEPPSPVTTVADQTPPSPAAAPQAAPAKKPAVKHTPAKRKRLRKHAPNRAATVP
ncbi:hypothetical protein [Reyranella sp.]|jgi:hypothetical protein|uniref:hypothetical protein n=1 Tax=Reyranella sp. TaxID=1929291 RepID=UPI002F92F725